jgi:DtxR family Mn-dependent transcriptional regulator
MRDWREFDQNPITHSAAHHLVAIAELLGEFGYARVSDVARRLGITRGSVSVTLKGLKGRGLVTEDVHRFIGLSADGERIARGVMAKKQVLKGLLMDLLGVPEAQADRDTCKIEHLVSDETAARASRALLFLRSGAADAQRFVAALREFGRGDAEGFPSAEVQELAREIARQADEMHDAEESR